MEKSLLIYIYFIKSLILLLLCLFFTKIFIEFYIFILEILEELIDSEYIRLKLFNLWFYREMLLAIYDYIINR